MGTWAQIVSAQLHLPKSFLSIIRGTGSVSGNLLEKGSGWAGIHSHSAPKQRGKKVFGRRWGSYKRALHLGCLGHSENFSFHHHQRVGNSYLLCEWRGKELGSLHFSMQEVGGSYCHICPFWLLFRHAWCMHDPRNTMAVLPSVASPHSYLLDFLIRAGPKLLSVRWPNVLWMQKMIDVFSIICSWSGLLMALSHLKIWD